MQISNDWFVAETEFENKSLIIRGRLFLDAIRQSGKFATRIALEIGRASCRERV